MSEQVVSRANNDSQSRLPRMAVVGGLGLAAVLGLSSCSGKESPDPAASSSSTVYEVDPGGGVSPHATYMDDGPHTRIFRGKGPKSGPPTLTFNYLQGNSRVIQVYPGPTESDTDRQSTGTFMDGDTAKIKCVEEGRDVVSQSGETLRESNAWLDIEVGDREFFATAVYADVSGRPAPRC